jgi:hypothetical protein
MMQPKLVNAYSIVASKIALADFVEKLGMSDLCFFFVQTEFSP